MITGADHVGISVSDIDRSIAFYRDILGLQLVEQRQFNNGQIAFFQVGDTLVELVANRKPGEPVADGLVNHFAFTVDDLAAAVARLRQHQVLTETPAPVPIWEGMRVIFFRGPDGERLELFERKL